MADILAVTFPFFALVLCGYLAAWRRMLPLEAVPGLNGFVLFFALPCMLFRFGSSAPIAQLLNPATIGVWLTCALVMVGFTIAVTLNARVRWNDASFGAMVATFPNSGFMGVPLLVALLGDKAAATVIATLIVDAVITTSLCLALSRLDGAGAQGARAAAGQALRGVLSNPMPWAIFGGGLFSVMDWQLWAPLNRAISLLAEAASPVALFTIGAVLARSRLQQGPQAVPAPDVLLIAGLKLGLHPVLVLCVGALAVSLGLGLEREALGALVLIAALPSASNVSMLAERYGADNGRVARIILWSTVVAFFSFSLVARWMA
ncbi:MAG: hypothetical protein RL758_566 [Pseudomonadota bacterium]|jgi:malonate transporter and related proteins